ncbi:MAG: hypothetical protein EA396_07450 [Anaerolineaceae bacterium]|nr:MAG: hypothetical protein EA396_07450 [Anaerolineaceae bacterium]
MNRAIRLLIFVGYAGGVAAIFYGFFLMDWRTLPDSVDAPRRGYEFARLTLDQFQTQLLLIGEELSPDLLRGMGDAARDIIADYWPTLAIFSVVLLGVGHAFAALTALVMVIIGRPLYPPSRFRALFIVFGVVFGLTANVIVPSFIMYRFYDGFLAAQVVASGFWLTLAGVIVAGATGPLTEFIRLFIPHPVTRPVKRPHVRPTFDETPITADYFDDEPPSAPPRRPADRIRSYDD